MSATAPTEAPPKLFVRTGIREDLLDDDACKVVSRLRRKGHESFLVGGCVRDLLLRRIPKDFDVATEARPRQVKSLFRNCRIIGRRFKLAHLHFDKKILEVSTFRRPPDENQNDDEDDLLIRSDNAFGSAREDAYRRDFTINALFFDPESDSIHDYVSGIEDIERGVVRTIGDPLTRIKEDPVRILRAIKFAARLGLRIDDATWEAMREAAEDLSRSAPPRLLEEVTRLLKSGSSLRAFQLLRDCGALSVLLPELGAWLDSEDVAARMKFWRGLEALDSRVRKNRRAMTTPLVFARMLWPMFASENGDDDKLRDADLGKLVESVLGPILKNLSFSRLESGRLKRILVVQRRFRPTTGASGGRSRGFKPATFIKQDYFVEALRLFEMRCITSDDGWEELDRWSALYEEQTGDETPVPRATLSEPGTEFDDEAREKTRSDRDRAKRDEGGRRNRRGQSSQSPRATRDSRNGDRKERKGGGEKRSRNQRGDESRSRKSRDEKRGRRGKRGRGAQIWVEPESTTPLPPLPDVELDPTQIPTYGSVLGDTGSADKIELEKSKGKRARKRMLADEEPYVPPPPPEDSGRGKGDDDDTFGDW